ncbi:hypothetical protein PsorP6_004952 [Peronosclerospora sorghi]|uniref:Uncharacterized protein n=1 Tax=Peronosclerospora sorghi TaxID=230839 RepID=A0ACC0W525_9STRA|nr:hypothetical protein PsorP6_004952 [Peronosclerospora sorghi]
MRPPVITAVTVVTMQALGGAFNRVAMSHLVSNISTQHSREYIKYNEERGEGSISASSTLRELLAKIGRKADVEDLSNHPALQTAIEYLEKRKIGKLPRAENSLIKELISSYNVNGVARIIEEGKSITEKGESKDSSIKTLINRMQSEFMQFLIDKKSPGDVFKLLKLDEQGESLFQSPLLNTWKNYVDTYNEFQHEHISLFATLKEQFNAEKQDELIRMLFDAKMRRIKKTVRRMRAEQSRTWLSRGIPPDDIFDLLELRKDKFARMDGKRFTLWKEYANDFYSKFPEEDHDPMHILQKKYGYEFLVNMIFDAKEIPETRRIAKEVEKDLWKYWSGRYGSKNMNDPTLVDDVLKDLKLDQDKNPFDELRFYTWTEYLDFLKRNSPHLKIDVLATLTKLLGEDKVIRGLKDHDEDLVNILCSFSYDSLQLESLLARVNGKERASTMLRKRKRDEDAQG